MRKASLIIPFLLFTCLSSFGQKIKFCDSSNIWKIYWFSASGQYPEDGVTKYRYSGKQNIDTAEYRKLIDTFFAPIGLGLIREDSMSSRVYIRIRLGSSYDTVEQILYDYNWQVGDTITRTIKDSFVHVVSNIDSTLISGTWHKVWHFKAISHKYNATGYDIIEGIGCTRDPLFPLYPSMFEAYTQLSCFTNANGTPPVSPTVSLFFDNVGSCTMDVKDATTSNLILAPNPINETTKIYLPQSTKSGSVNIINCMGQAVFNEHFQNSETISIGDKIKVPGIYLYHITDYINGKEYSGKFTKD